jgi:hypothetical protein
LFSFKGSHVPNIYGIISIPSKPVGADIKTAFVSIGSLSYTNILSGHLQQYLRHLLPVSV